MNTYEKLQNEACNDGIDVISYSFNSQKIKDYIVTEQLPLVLESN